MWNDLLAFLLFLLITIFSWFVSYSDFEELMICYGCNKLQPAYDFIIVGGGTAGCVLARRLAENKSASILIIEAGGRGNSFLSIPVVGPMLQQSNFDWKYTTTRQTGSCLSLEKQRCKYPLGKILGGSHQINNMIYTRGHPQDYDPWFKDFPGYSYEKDVEEYFNRAEQIYHSNESISHSQAPALISPVRFFSVASSIILMAFNRLGYVTSPPTQKYFGGFYRPLVTQKNGRRWTTSDHLLELKLPNVAILTKARAEKILFKDNLEATAVRYNYLGDNMIAKARRALILSAGTIGSAKLLMLSGIGPKDHLKKLGIKVLNDLPVGNNFQDHMTTGFDLMLVKKSIGLSMLDILHPFSMIQYYLKSQGAWTANGVDLIGFSNLEFTHCKNQVKNNFTLCYQKYSQLRPDIEFMMLPLGLTSDLGIHLRTLFGITDNIWDNYFAKINESAMGILPILLHPKSRGTVRLANKNPNSKPLINPNYLSHPYDMKVLLRFIVQVRKLYDRAFRGTLGLHLNETPFPGCEKHEFGTKCYWECYVRQMSSTCYHPIGTCKMGITNDSVVDFDFHVHGTHKLFVVDGSVLPTQVSGHTMAPIIMMAERASDYIKKFQGFDLPKPKIFSKIPP
ncbi:hypothetical protein HHI36_015750 [Cryptolaemus montrouzieri]|uniref:Glucose dehydrogenase [FAD, quinone]-like n=1 Tax=Cryptolaemus montrouzieri TaxID=559131 RepID=A0ABD2N6K0_9CUCU